MVELNGLRFASNIGVLFALKEKYGHKRVQETYALLEKTDMDIMLDVLVVSYNKANKVGLSMDEFVQLLDEKELGFMFIADTFTKVVENIMFSGLTEEQIKERKNQMMNLEK